MSKLPWELTDADEPGAADLGLPVTGDEARSLLRGQAPREGLRAEVTQRGRFADLLGLGWPGLYALSPRMSSTLGELVGLRLTPVQIDGGPDGYMVLGATGRCGSVDYKKSVEVERLDDFVLLRGLHVDDPGEAVDFAVPGNWETVLMSLRAADLIRRGNFSNVEVVPIDEIEFYISQQELSTHSEN